MHGVNYKISSAVLSSKLSNALSNSMERKLSILNNAYKSKLERHVYGTSVAPYKHTTNVQTIKDAVNTNVVQVHVQASVKYRYMT